MSLYPYPQIPSSHKSAEDAVCIAKEGLVHWLPPDEVASAHVRLVGESENLVFEITIDKKGSPLILRLVSESHRFRKNLEAEARWLSILASETDLQLPRFIPSRGGKLVESLEQYFVSVYQKLLGKALRREVAEDWSPRVFEEWGRVLGVMHSLALKTEEPLSRPWFYDEPTFRDFTRLVPPSECALHRAFKEVKRWLLKECGNPETSRRRTGLIHSDLHFANFLWESHSRSMQLLDFDDLQYHFFAYDLAIPMMTTEGLVQAVNPQECKTALLTSYAKTYSYADEVIQDLPHLVALRKLWVYAWYHWRFGLPQNPVPERLVEVMDSIRKSF